MNVMNVGSYQNHGRLAIYLLAYHFRGLVLKRAIGIVMIGVQHIASPVAEKQVIFLF